MQTAGGVDGFSDEALKMLLNYDWPGNVRQLKNVVERLVIMADQSVLDSPYLSVYSGIRQSRKPDAIPDTLAELKSIKKHWLNDQFGQIEKAFLYKALAAENGNIARAAKRVGMQRSNFSALMKRRHLSADTVKKSQASGGELN